MPHPRGRERGGSLPAPGVASSVYPTMRMPESAATIISPRTARSQFVGGMTMGLSTASNEGVASFEARWLDEQEPYVKLLPGLS